LIIAGCGIGQRGIAIINGAHMFPTWLPRYPRPGDGKGAIMHTRVILAVLALVCAGPARAEDCGPLKRLASVDMIPGPGGVRMLVPVTINGASRMLLLDTAAGFTTLTATAASELNLHVLDGSRLKLLDSAGNASRKYVVVEDFQIGGLQGKDIPFMITPNPNAGQDLAFAGVLAGDMMAKYDVDLDFAARKMQYFSHDHCAGHVVYWPATMIAVVPFRMQHPIRGVIGERPRLPLLEDTHIRVPVTLDGKTFQAVINTGAVRSTMSANTAKFAFGITADSPGSVPLGAVDHDPNHRVFGHVFGSLAFEGVTVTNPHVAIRPDLFGSKDPDNGFAIGSHAQRVDDGIGPEITIGMDVLRRLHLYIAFDERKLYITPATSSGTEAAPAAQAGNALQP
jgi:predicted aspartyl protease